MSWSRRWTRSLTVATLGLGGATALAAWALWQALNVGQVDRVSGEPSARPPVRPSIGPSVRPPTPAGLRRAAVQANPFRPERAPAALAFRMPSEELPAPVVSSDRAPLLLVGTAVLPGNRGFALLQVGAESPKLVRLGEQLGGFTLKSVAQGSATVLTSTGTTLDLTVPKAGSLRAN